ncbi:signal peptidase I [Spirulina sp. CS-785/01]|uniref:signal peptidase I n=1 Tax=Spirulina sp. CS-785/01 TaxID=3021716 RepID=UPI00232DAC1A|nr:signal peptidase I [Spirulina sp. CS-785/01]MDB9315855.1 signal peptidase I [Spirulina sp. CS-785/01]
MHNRKDPWLAINLSFFFPGLGQFYARNWGKGWSLLLGEVGLLAIALWCIFAPTGQPLWGLVAVLLAGGVYLGNLFDAYHCCEETFPHPQGEKIPRTQKNIWFAVLLSRILPGFGQLYSGRVGWGLGFISITVILVLLNELLTGLLWVSPVVSAIAVYHVYQTFPTPNRTGKIKRSLFILLVATLVSWGLFLNYFPLWLSNSIELFIIPSSSMQPTLQIGDRILVKKSDNYQPQPGDLVVFVAPEAAQKNDPFTDPDEEIIYIKRIIGQPGQTLQVRRGVVYLNQSPLNEDYLASPPHYEVRSQLIPEQMYWVLGDNRNESFDSHVWGFLPEQNIIGQAYKIVFPPQRVRSLL